MGNPTTTGRDDSAQPSANPESPAELRTRLDAIARGICVRVCEERFTEDQLGIIGRVVELVLEDDSTPLIDRLKRDRFDADEDSEVRGYRRGWNGGMNNAIALVIWDRMRAAFNELRNAPAMAYDRGDGRVVAVPVEMTHLMHRFDVGGE